MKIKLQTVTTVAIVLAAFVVMLGAYTRLTDAGLGCPDWPGCYGHLVLPSESAARTLAQGQYPEIPIEAEKAWTEMAHRYAAGSLGLLIAFIFVSAWRRREVPVARIIPSLLVALVIFQAALGMWTVTLKLLPIVVMGHLLGGMLIFGGLCYFRRQLTEHAETTCHGMRVWVGLGVVIVFIQIALGGWVSSNYAGIACIGFPQCNGSWWPTLDWTQGFNLLPVGANYQGGVLEHEARVTIQFVHRLGALVTAAYLLGLAGVLWVRYKQFWLRWWVGAVVVLTGIQLALGIINVVYLLPLWSAVAHNGIAALLFSALLSLFYLTGRGQARVGSN